MSQQLLLDTANLAAMLDQQPSGFHGVAYVDLERGDDKHAKVSCARFPFRTVQAAINASASVIKVGPGTSEEQLEVRSPGVAIVGMGADLTRLGAIHAKDAYGIHLHGVGFYKGAGTLVDIENTPHVCLSGVDIGYTAKGFRLHNILNLKVLGGRNGALSSEIRGCAGVVNSVLFDRSLYVCGDRSLGLHDMSVYVDACRMQALSVSAEPQIVVGPGTEVESFAAKLYSDMVGSKVFFGGLATRELKVTIQPGPKDNFVDIRGTARKVRVECPADKQKEVDVSLCRSAKKPVFELA